MKDNSVSSDEKIDDQSKKILKTLIIVLVDVH